MIKKKVIDDFNAQAKIVNDADREYRSQLQVIIQSIAGLHQLIGQLGGNKSKILNDCAKINLYYKLLKDFLNVI